MAIVPKVRTEDSGGPRGENSSPEDWLLSSQSRRIILRLQTPQRGVGKGVVLAWEQLVSLGVIQGKGGPCDMTSQWLSGI